MDNILKDSVRCTIKYLHVSFPYNYNTAYIKWAELFLILQKNSNKFGEFLNILEFSNFVQNLYVIFFIFLNFLEFLGHS